MLSPAGSTSTGTPSFFQICSISCSRSSFRFFFSARSTSMRTASTSSTLALPAYTASLKATCRRIAAGCSASRTSRRKPAFFRRWIVPVARSPAPRTTIRSFFFIFAVFLLSFQQPPFSSVFRGLPRYSRARITLFPLIKIQERTRFVNVSP